MAETIYEHLKEQARLQAEIPFFVATGCPPLTYARFLSHVQSLAAVLRSCGIGRQHRVGVILPNGPELGGLILAVSSCAVCVPLNPNYSAAEVMAILPQLRVETVILPPGSAHLESCRKLGLAVLEARREAHWPAGIVSLGREAAHSGEVEWGRPEDVAIIYHTSGTTARPKVVPITHGNLCQPLSAYSAHYRLTPQDRAMGSTPLFHAFGVTVLLTTTIASGGSVAFPPDYSAAALCSGLEEHRATRLAAVPAMLDSLADHVERNGPSPGGHCLRMIQTGSNALNLATAARLEDFFGVPVLSGYGMSEIGVTLTGHPLPPRPRIMESVGLALFGEVGVMAEDGRLLPTGEQGEIVTRGGGVFSGYEDNEAANAEAFSNGWLHTGDRGYVDAEGYIFITGRFKEMINRGGNKVSPAEVDEALLQLPGVRDAACFPVPHPRLGEDLAAMAVRLPGMHLNAGDVRRLLRERLADYKIPNRIIFVDAIPKNDIGKVQRKALAGLLAEKDAREAAARPFVGPRNAVEAALAEHWQEALGLGQVSVDDDFFALGGDSLQAVILLTEIEVRWGRAMPVSVLMERGTIAGLARLILEDEAQLDPLVVIQPAGTQPPLFCLHALFGDVIQYHALKHYCSEDQPIYGLRFTQWNALATQPMSTSSLAREYLQRIKDIQPVGPYRLVGHSSGGLLAYEMAHQLAASGEKAGLVLLLDTGTPEYMLPTPLQWLRVRWMKLLKASPREKKDLLARFIKRTLADMRGRSRKRQPTVQKLVNGYVPPRYSGDVVLFLAKDGLVREHWTRAADRSLGWAKHVAGALRIVDVPGDHGTMLQEPNVGVLAARLNEMLSSQGQV